MMIYLHPFARVSPSFVVLAMRLYTMGTDAAVLVRKITIERVPINLDFIKQRIETDATASAHQHLGLSKAFCAIQTASLGSS